MMYHDNYTIKTMFVADIVQKFFCTKFVCLWYTLRIAICDDDSACRIEVTQPVKEYIVQSSLPMELRIYENGTGLLQDARRTGSFDIYILDILMPLNNINHGIQLRELEQVQIQLIEQTLKNYKFFRVLGSIFLFDLQILTA